MSKIIAIDASSTNIGWAYAENLSVTDCGVRRINPKIRLGDRFCLAMKYTMDSLREKGFGPGCIGIVEEPFAFRGQRSNMACFGAFACAVASIRFCGATALKINPSSWQSFILLGRRLTGDELKEAIFGWAKTKFKRLAGKMETYDASDATAMLWAYITTNHGACLGKKLGERV